MRDGMEGAEIWVNAVTICLILLLNCNSNKLEKGVALLSPKKVI